MGMRIAGLVVAALAVPASADGYKKLNNVKALESAKAKGLRLDVIVPYPVECPAVAKTSVDLSGLTSAKNGLGFSLEALLREDIGIAEIVAALGPPVLCDHEDDSQFTNMYLATKANTVEIETMDGALIGVNVRLDKPMTMDLKAIAKTFGAPEQNQFGLWTKFDTDAFEGGLIIYTDAEATAPSAKVSQIILRRTSKLTIFPRSYTSEADVSRFIAMSAAIKPPRINDYYGPLGSLRNGSKDVVNVNTFPDKTNIKKASLRQRKVEKADVLKAVEVTFAKPIKATPASLVSAIAAATKVAKPKVAKGTKATTITLPTATVVLTFAGGSLTGLSLTRK
jgi:hypothetical protein